MHRAPVWLRISAVVACVALVSLAVAPIVYQRYVGALRTTITLVHEPATAAEGDIRMALAREIAAVRGFVLIGDTALLSEYRHARTMELVAQQQLVALAPRLDPVSQDRIRATIERSSEWNDLNERLAAGRITTRQLMPAFATQQQRYLAALAASGDLQAALLVSTRAVRQQTRAAERLWTVSSVVLAMLAAACGIIVILMLRTSLAEHSLARTDVLTDLLNRRGFHEQAAIELARARRYRFVVTMLAIDVDGFKQVNDELGHDAGDRLLCDVADGLRRALRVTDVPSRLGGDEFAVLLTDNRHDPPELLVAEVRDRVMALLGERRWPVSVSIGAVTTRESGDVASLLADADRHMYAAKRSGKNAISHAEVRFIPAPVA